MMILILTIVALFILGIIIYNFRENEIIGTICFILVIFLGAALFAEVSISCLNNLSAPGLAVQYEQRYESLTYQLENNLYSNENEIGKKQLYSEIQAYNEEVASGKKMQDDIWVGIFYPHIYDEFELIELE